MPLRKKSLANCKLYLILDRAVQDYPALFETAAKAISAGVDIIQLRDKTGSASEILEFSKRILKLTRGKIPYIINDRVDLAMIAKASGVHLGQDDISFKEARRIMGQKAMIGISCQTFEQAKKGERHGVDYIGFGSVFKTLTKPQREPMNLDLLKKVFKEIKIPVFAIGGITLKNFVNLKALDVRRVAVCRAVLEAEDIKETVKKFKKS